MPSRHEKTGVGCVLAGLVIAAVLLFAIGSASAQTSSANAPTSARVEAGSSAPTTEPRTESTTEKAEPPQQAPTPDPAADGFKVGVFVFKPGGRIKLDIIKDYDALTSEDSFDPRTIVVPSERRRQFETACA